MSVRTLYPVPLLLLFLLFSVTGHTQLRKIYLQPKTIAREKQSTFVDSIRFIPLEAKEDIELGMYYNTEITNQYLILVDYLNKRLIFYTRDGCFVKLIKYSKLGGDFYPNYRESNNQLRFYGNNKNYTLTPKDRIQIELDWANPRNQKYFRKYTIDLNDSSLTVKKENPNEKDILGVYPFYDDYYLQQRITVSKLYEDSLDYELKLYKNNQLIKSFFPYNKISEPRFLYSDDFVSSVQTDTPYNRIMLRPYSDTVYKLVKDSLIPTCKLVFPLENSLPASFYSQPFKNKVDRENFDRNNGWMFRQLYSFNETPRLIYFTVRYLSNSDSYIYDKQKDITYKTKNIKADSSQFNLSLLSDFSLQHRGNYFYKALKASDLLPFFEKNKDAVVPRELEAFIKSKPPASTPIIVEFKLKN